jgi:predicted phosphodiesterase
MKKLIRYGYIAYLSLMLGCDIEYHAYDTDFKGIEGGQNAKNINILTNPTTIKDTIRFVWFGDTQRFYNETNDFVTHINTKENIDFVLHGGDITDFGLKSEFIWIEDILNNLSIPHICIIGNHDLLGSGESSYRYLYGDPDFSFIFNRIKFLCLNTNHGESSYEVPNYDFIEQNILDSISETYDYTIIASHKQSGVRDLENISTKDSMFYKTTNKARNVLFYLYAHTHKVTIENPSQEGITHFTTGSMKERVYFLFSIYNGKYTYEVKRY